LCNYPRFPLVSQRADRRGSEGEEPACLPRQAEPAGAKNAQDSRFPSGIISSKFKRREQKATEIR